MELAVELADFPYLPRPLSPAHAITVATMCVTGIIPYAYQVRCTEALYQGRDFFCIAGTGCGKTLSFVMLCFLCLKTIVWIV
jgi:superfamily II DNA or RNA helicase